MPSLVSIKGIDEAFSNLSLGDKTLKARLLIEIRSHFQSDDDLQQISSIATEELVATLWGATSPDEIKVKRKNLSSLKSSVNKTLKQLTKAGNNPEGIIIGRDNTFIVSEEHKDSLIQQLGITPGSIKSMRDIFSYVRDFLSEATKKEGKEEVLALLDELEETKKLIRKKYSVGDDESLPEAIEGNGPAEEGTPTLEIGPKKKAATEFDAAGEMEIEEVEVTEDLEPEEILGDFEEVEELEETEETEIGAGPAGEETVAGFEEEVTEDEIVEVEEQESEEILDDFEEVEAGLAEEISAEEGDLEEIEEVAADDGLETEEFFEDEVTEEGEKTGEEPLPEEEPEDEVEEIELADDEELVVVSRSAPAGEQPGEDGSFPEDIGPEEVEEIFEDELPAEDIETEEIETLPEEVAEIEADEGLEPETREEFEEVETEPEIEIIAEEEELEEVGELEEVEEIATETEEISEEEVIEEAEETGKKTKGLGTETGETEGGEFAPEEEIEELKEIDEEQLAVAEEELEEIEEVEVDEIPEAEEVQEDFAEVELEPETTEEELELEEVEEVEAEEITDEEVLEEGEETEEIIEEPLPEEEPADEIEEIELADDEELVVVSRSAPTGEPGETGSLAEDIGEITEDTPYEEIEAEEIEEEEIEEIDETEVDEELVTEEVAEDAISEETVDELTAPTAKEERVDGSAEHGAGIPAGEGKEPKGVPNLLEVLSEYMDAEEALKDEGHVLSETHEEYISQILSRFTPKFIKVPTGNYTVGNNHPKSYEQREHKIRLASFYIGQLPVTNDLFELFIRDTGYETDAERTGYGLVHEGQCVKATDPDTGLDTLTINRSTVSQRIKGANWRSPGGPGKESIANKHNHPVVQVSRRDAMAFAAWAGKRLPTEEEWEATARGQDGRLFPWGNIWQDKLGNFSASCNGDTTPVERYGRNAASPFAIYDMLGNVYEWTATTFESPLKPEGRAIPPSYILKGGCWTSRGMIAAFQRLIEHETWSNVIGFRCAV